MRVRGMQTQAFFLGKTPHQASLEKKDEGGECDAVLEWIYWKIGQSSKIARVNGATLEHEPVNQRETN